MHGILDGISSLHSWMKNQASTASGVRRGDQRGQQRNVQRERIQTYDEVCDLMNKHMTLLLKPVLSFNLQLEKGKLEVLRCNLNSIFQELDEDVVITLTAKDPQAPKNKIRFDHNSGV